MSSGAIEVRYVKKLHFMNVILNFAEEKVFSKTPGCAGASPVMSVGDSELLLKSLCEIAVLLVGGRQYLSQLSNILAQTERLYEDCGSSQTHSTLKRILSFCNLTQWDFLMKMKLYSRALSFI